MTKNYNLCFAIKQEFLYFRNLSPFAENIKRKLGDEREVFSASEGFRSRPALPAGEARGEDTPDVSPGVKAVPVKEMLVLAAARVAESAWR